MRDDCFVLHNSRAVRSLLSRQRIPAFPGIAVIILPVHVHIVFAEKRKNASQRPLQAFLVADVVGNRAALNGPFPIVSVVLHQIVHMRDAFRFEPDQRLHAMRMGEINGFAEGVPGPFDRIQLPRSDRAPPVALHRVPIWCEIPPGIKPPVIDFNALAEHLLQRRLPSEMPLGNAAVRIGNPGIPRQPRGTKGFHGIALGIEFGQVAIQKPPAPDICGMVLIPYRIGDKGH